MTVIDAEDKHSVQAMIDADPVILHQVGFRYDVFQMPGAFAR